MCRDSFRESMLIISAGDNEAVFYASDKAKRVNVVFK